MYTDKQIQNMLNYLSNKNYSIHKFNDNKFELRLNIDNNKHDNCEYIIDFNNKTIYLYSYDESRHNGDHYNCEYIDLPWSELNRFSLHIKSMMESTLHSEVQKEQIQSLVDSKFNSILNS